MSECPIHRAELLLGRCWMCRGVPPGAASRSEQSASAYSPTCGATAPRAGCWYAYGHPGVHSWGISTYSAAGGEAGAALRWLADEGAAAGINPILLRAALEKITAEPGRSTSDRPPVNPPVASADPELAKLLRAARNAIEELHGMYAYADLLARIDALLSEGKPGK